MSFGNRAGIKKMGPILAQFRNTPGTVGGERPVSRIGCRARRAVAWRWVASGRTWDWHAPRIVRLGVHRLLPCVELPQE
jgi:hypothetical protein